MSIDGIGRPPRPPGGAGSAEGPSAPVGGGEGFHVESGAAAAKASSTSSAGALGQLERGEISVDQYLDARVEEAVSPLSGRLPPETLEFMKSSLRTELSNDPVLVELVRRATGMTPPPSET